MSSTLRLCLDLNIWCAALLSQKKQRQHTAAQLLVALVRNGECALGPVQLVISWGMLNRLQKVWETDWKIDPTTVQSLVEAIAGYAQLGPVAQPPYLLLGGTGVLALADEEDAHVLDTALAGKADYLITANFDDFITSSAQVLEPNRLARYASPKGSVVIVHPYLFIAWVRQGQIPDS
ncbi:PIN domain-containing protein [Anthocerotibacter panamensis]|uniref:PIN domain-containing protein n=1 Tax=Anthocerotibacter panamensis TaxID=2857077 RepID=UPI001C404C01|nr:PIN domain-containing protein [Anthocerotibacter panamensis]